MSSASISYRGFKGNIRDAQFRGINSDAVSPCVATTLLIQRRRREVKREQGEVRVTKGHSPLSHTATNP